jgi:hypothetical protein
MSRGVRLTSILALGFVAALAILVAQRDSSSAQPPFAPGAFTCFEIIETSAACDGDSAPGAVTDIHSSFCIGWNDDCSTKDSPVTDSNFGGVVGFTPEPFVIPGGNDLPLGTVVGRLTSEATLGILNNPCSTTIQVAFTIMNASINIGDTIDPKPVGQTDVLEPLALDGNNNGLPDGVDRYPSFLNETFDNLQPRARLFGISFIQGSWVSLNFVFFEPGATFETANQIVTLKSELGVPSVTVLNNPEAPPAPGVISDFCAPLLSDNIALGQTINNPCTPASVNGAACPGTQIYENRGYPLFPCETGNALDEDGDGKINDGCPQVGAVAESGAMCDNNTSDDFEDSDINDGCPVVGGESEGTRLGGGCSGTDEGGCVFRQNPAAGTVTLTTLTASQRDADGDGIENSLDTCWEDANSGWNPRGIDAANDTDLDGIPNECDPDPNNAGDLSPVGCEAGQVGPDEDQDCYNNRQDSCFEDNQLPQPGQPPGSDNTPDVTDTDSDGIADACDPNPNDADAQGEPAFICLKMALQVGGPAKAVATRDADESLDCAAASRTTPDGGGATPTPPPSDGGGDNGGTGGGGTGGGGTGGGGVGGGPDTGVGSLAPTATNISVWAIVLAALGGIGVLAGIRILRSRRIDSRK